MSLRNKVLKSSGNIEATQYATQWRQLFGSNSPKRIGLSLRSALLAQGTQEKRICGQGRAVDRQLRSAMADVLETPKLKRNSVGSRLVRGWGGVNHEVTVLPKGFSYRGTVYRSLSQIARLITGTRWSGPRFFGLNTEKAP